jgi:hypothetical protein
VAAAGTGLLDGITSKPLEMIKLRQQILPAAARGVATASAVRLDGALAAAAGAATTATATAAAVRLPLRALPTASGPLRHLSDVAAALTQGWGGHHPATVASATASTAAVRMSPLLALPHSSSPITLTVSYVHPLFVLLFFSVGRVVVFAGLPVADPRRRARGPLPRLAPHRAQVRCLPLTVADPLSFPISPIGTSCVCI